MRSSVNWILIILLAGTMAAAQTASTPAAAKAAPTLATRPASKAAAKPAAPAPATELPSEATVDSFLQQTFGYQKDLSWKISSIKPSTVAGLAEVNVVVASPQGQQLSRLYVSSDGEHAV